MILIYRNNYNINKIDNKKNSSIMWITVEI